MLAREITSLQHPLVKHLCKLRKERAYRDEKKTVLIIGRKMVFELSAHFSLKTLLFSKEPPPIEAEKKYKVTDDILKKISALQSPESIVAEIALPKESDLSKKEWLLVLDGISDPGNMGTLFRSALSLGWDGIFILENSCDPFNDKALRSAKGATFFFPYAQGGWEKLRPFLKTRTSYLADLKGTTLPELKVTPPLALILGSEAKGASLEAKKQAKSITIPIKSSVESLNVAAAGAILLYTMKTL